METPIIILKDRPGKRIIRFHVNPDIDLEKIRTSMQLDSGQQVAWLEVGSYEVSLEVRGDVWVIFNPDPDGSYEDGETYKTPSDFPEGLKKFFSEEENAADLPNVYVVNNNWFEIFVSKDGAWTGWSDMVDAEGMDPKNLFGMLYDTYKEYIESERQA